MVLGSLASSTFVPSSSVRVTMYFNPTEPRPAGAIYPEVRFVDLHPTQANTFSINSSSGGITGMLSEVSGDMASGTVASTGAAKTEFAGAFEVRVCP